VPGVDSIEAFLQEAAEFAVVDLELQAEPSAVSAARQSLDDSGLLLLGEMHGVRENPLLIRALMQAFGHLAVLAERTSAGPFELTLFDGIIGADWSWSQRDEAMATRILAGAAAGICTLAVAGNAHTPVSHTELGIPMGACLAQRRPGVREISINYCGGSYYNFGPGRFAPIGPQQRQIRLYQHDDALVLDLPSASEAVVPQHSQPWPPPARDAP
jgi:hypothetical protein